MHTDATDECNLHQNHQNQEYHPLKQADESTLFLAGDPARLSPGFILGTMKGR